MTSRGIAVLVLLLAACGSAPLAADDFQTTYVKAWCERAARCGVVASAELCEAGNLYDSGQLRASVAAGRATYDGDAARACVDAIVADDACTFIGSSACSDLVSGLRQPGEACVASLDCAAGTCALPDSCTEQCCAGTCVAQGSVGAACTTSATCAGDLVCTPAADFSSSSCQARPAEDEACAFPGQCAEGLFCAVVYLPDDTTSGKCAVPAERGKPCDVTSGADSCRSIDDYCSATTSTCVARVEVGMACERSGGGPFSTGSTCRLHAYCDDATGLCKPLGAGVGASCTEASCEYGYVCNAQSLCEPRPVRPVCE